MQSARFREKIYPSSKTDVVVDAAVATVLTMHPFGEGKFVEEQLAFIVVTEELDFYIESSSPTMASL